MAGLPIRQDYPASDLRWRAARERDTRASLRLLEFNDAAAWLPARAGETIEAGAWLALALFLTVGFWWRSPGLGVTAPLVVAGMVVVSDVMRDVAAIGRGLAIALPLRPAYGVVLATVLALVALAVTGFLMWRRRKPSGRLGAPPPPDERRRQMGVLVIFGVFLLLLPLFAASVAALVLIEKLVFPALPEAARWLGVPPKGKGATPQA